MASFKTRRPRCSPDRPRRRPHRLQPEEGRTQHRLLAGDHRRHCRRALNGRGDKPFRQERPALCARPCPCRNPTQRRPGLLSARPRRTLRRRAAADAATTAIAASDEERLR